MMMKYLKAAHWNPYIAGALVGILAVATVLVTTVVLNKGHYLGASTTFVRVAGLLEEAVQPQQVQQNAYYQKTKLKVDWQMMFLAGIFGGALVASRLGGTATCEHVPPVWRQRFGNSVVLRALAAFGGGAVLLFGGRLAGGCPSGHGMSGNMQLSVGSLLALVCFIVGGVVTARLVYGKGGR